MGDNPGSADAYLLLLPEGADGASEQAPCDHQGLCPVCAQDRQTSSPCSREQGHTGDHQCGYGDLFEVGLAEIL
jgi:hypothetical protein